MDDNRRGEQRLIPLHRVKRSRFQPRGYEFDESALWELACSIKEASLINAIVVFPQVIEGVLWYELVAGERRTRAVTALAWAGIEDGVSEREAVRQLAEFGILVSEDGCMYPRCEGFSYAKNRMPVLRGMMQPDKVGFHIGRSGKARSQVLWWLYAILKHDSNWGNCSWCWGILRWLDSGAAMVNGKNDYRKLISWLKQEWDDLGGDEVMATLMDVAISEVAALNWSSRSKKTRKLLNAVTGEEEVFASASWFDFTSKAVPYGYPEGWPAPWAAEPEADPES